MSAPADTAVRVLCIAGSPRRQGNSDQMLDALVRGVRAAGGEAVELHAAAAGLNPCRGCNACSLTGQCVIRDGMDDVYREIDAADAVAVATPVFFATVPAVLKMLIDRLQPYWARRFVLGEPPRPVKRPGAILIVGGGGDPFGTDCAVAPVKSAFAVIAVRADEVLVSVGPDAPGEVGNLPDILARAEEIGRELVESARKQRAWPPPQTRF